MELLQRAVLGVAIGFHYYKVNVLLCLFVSVDLIG